MLVFVVDDDEWYSSLLEYQIKLNPDNEVEIYQDGNSLLSNLNKNPDVITLDYKLPDYDGEVLLNLIKKKLPGTPVIIVSNQQDIKTAINLLKDGAYDYVIKDDDAKDRIWNCLKNIQENVDLKNRIKYLQEEVQLKYDFSKSLIGESLPMKAIHKLMAKAVKSKINVSITGETGTGKEVVAKSIHFNSDRKNQKFIPVNIASIPKELMESELFGHEKGAFTGALTRRFGKFEEASGGTLFLDEIGEMDINLQAKILRVLQENEITRIGSNDIVKVDVRLITATHKNLAEEIQKGNFREDLYYRIIGLPIELPALRDRGNDILILANHFLQEYCNLNDMAEIKLSTEAQKKLVNHQYAGNVRELKSIIDLAAVMSDGHEILADNIIFNSVNSINNFLNEKRTLKEYTMQIIHHFLKKSDNNVTAVAKQLDIGRSTIYQLLKDNTPVDKDKK